MHGLWRRKPDTDGGQRASGVVTLGAFVSVPSSTDTSAGCSSAGHQHAAQADRDQEVTAHDGSALQGMARMRKVITASFADGVV
jgi:hypothetical protein